MKTIDRIKKEINIASGKIKASLVIKNANIVNVLTGEIEKGDVAVENGKIIGVGQYNGFNEIDIDGKYLAPSFIDGHIHLESSMVTPNNFEESVLPHGTTAVITDPHEIANVAGTSGIDYMLDATRNLILDIFFMLPSCVPATEMDESGAILHAEDLVKYYDNDRVLGLAEVMDFGATCAGQDMLMAKIVDAVERDRVIDGHAPMISDKDLSAYVTAGVKSDHECSNIEEAKKKFRRGQWIMVREGTAAQNLEALLPMFQYPFCFRSMLVTDDKHPNDLIKKGHMDYIIRKAISLGADPAIAIRMASFNPAKYFRIDNVGAIAPNYIANMVVIDNLTDFRIEKVFKEGKLVCEDGKIVLREKEYHAPLQIPDRVIHSFNMDEIYAKKFRLTKKGDNLRLIKLLAGEIITEELIVKAEPIADPDRDIVKVGVFERHKKTGHYGLGFINGYGLKKGAIATSIAHDSHNLIIAGVNDEDMAIAANFIRENNGGIALVVDGQVVSSIPLRIGGLMTDEKLNVMNRKLEHFKEKAKEAGIAEGIDPLMTLSFASLPVIPSLRINTYGVIDVSKQEIVEVSF